MKIKTWYLLVMVVSLGLLLAAGSKRPILAGSAHAVQRQDPGEAFLFIQKVTGDNSGSFEFTLLPTNQITTVVGGGISSAIRLTTGGDYQLIETVPTGWRLANVVCDSIFNTSIQITDENHVNLSNVVDQDVIGCTFTNEIPGTIIVRKLTQPTITFDFTFQPDFGSSFSLSHGEVETLDNVPLGNHSVTEIVPLGWDVSATCSDGSSSDIDPSNIPLTAGSTVDCSFTNTAQFTEIEVKKQATPNKVAPGEAVQYEYEVRNTSVAPLPLGAVVLSDDKCAPLVGPTGDNAPVGLLSISEVWRYTCTTSLTVDTLNTASVTAKDFINRDVNDSATAFVDVLPTVELSKRVTPSSRPEPGGVFTFTLTITNTSNEAVRIKELDDAYPLSDECQDLDETIMLANSLASCSYAVTLTQPGVYVNGASVTVREATNSHPSDTVNEASDQATASVTISDLPSSLAVYKQAQPSALPAPGGTITFTLFVTNTSSADSVTLTTVSDDETNDGTSDLSFSASDVCKVTLLPPGESTLCTFSRAVTGEPGAFTDNATVTAKDDDDATINGSAQATVYLLAGGVIGVDKTPNTPTVDEPGAAVTFDVTVSNNHPAVAIDLSELNDSVYGDVTSAGHDGLISTTCALVSVPAKDAYTCAFEARVSGDAGDLHTNTLTASGADSEANRYRGEGSAQLSVTDAPAILEVSKIPSPSEVPTEGGLVTFAINVKNASTADSITLDSFVDSVFGNLVGANPDISNSTCTPGQTLAVGDEYSCAFSALVVLELGGQHSNTLTVSATDDDGSQVESGGSATVLSINALGAASKRVALVEDVNQNGVANPGDTLGYTVVISNVGTDSGNFGFSDILDVHTMLVAGSISASAGSINMATNGFTVNSIPLAIDETATIGFRVQIKNPLPAGVTSVANQGLVSVPNAPTVSTDDPDTLAPDDPTVITVGASPALTVVKIDSLVEDANLDQVASPGDVVEYQVIVTNSGNQAATEITIDDTPDTNTTLIVGSVVAGQGSQVITGNSNGDTRVKVNLPNPLTVGAQATLSFRVRINQALSLDTVTISNQALVNGANVSPTPSDDPDTPASGDATVTNVAILPNVELFKGDALLVDADDDGVPSPGDTLVYHLSLLNSGARSATNVVVNDLLDANTVLVAGSVQRTQGEVVNGNNPGDTSVRINVGTLAANASITISFNAVIVNPLRAGVTQIQNQASVSGANFPTLLSDDPTTDAVDDPAITTVTATPALSVSKRDFLYQDADNDDQVGAGDTLFYVIQVVNNGNAAASNVRVRDTPDEQTTLQSGKVQTSHGTIIVGNSTGDSMVEIELGVLAPKSTVHIGIRVTINEGAGTTVFNQAVVEFINPSDVPGSPFTVVSDDSDTPVGNDPTVTVLRRGPLHLPLIFRRE